MNAKISRRTVMAGAVSALALSASRQASAQAKQKLRFSSAFTEADTRAGTYKSFAEAIKDDFDFEPYWGNQLFKQGTELVALQRDNLDLLPGPQHMVRTSTPRPVQPRAGRHLEANPRLVATHFGLSLQRRRPHEEDLQERCRQRIYQDGERPAWHSDHYADLLRFA